MLRSMAEGEKLEVGGVEGRKISIRFCDATPSGGHLHRLAGSGFSPKGRAGYYGSLHGLWRLERLLIF